MDSFGGRKAFMKSLKKPDEKEKTEEKQNDSDGDYEKRDSDEEGTMVRKKKGFR